MCDSTVIEKKWLYGSVLWVAFFGIVEYSVSMQEKESKRQLLQNFLLSFSDHLVGRKFVLVLIRLKEYANLKVPFPFLVLIRQTVKRFCLNWSWKANPSVRLVLKPKVMHVDILVGNVNFIWSIFLLILFELEGPPLEVY